MEIFTDLDREIQEIIQKFSQQVAVNYIRAHHPHLSLEPNYIPPSNCPDQLWQRTENSPIDWIFFSIALEAQPLAYNPSENRAFLESVFEEMLLSDHLPNQDLSIKLSEAFAANHLAAYSLHLCLDLDDLSLLSISQTELDLNLPPIIESPPALSSEKSSSSSESAILSETPSEPKLQNSIISLTLQQQADRLSRELSPSKKSLLSKLNPELLTIVQFKPIQDRYGNVTDLSLEYSPEITESELIEYLQRLALYQSFKHLDHLHHFISDRVQAWLKQNGQPHPSAIAPHLKERITRHSQNLYNFIRNLTDGRLKSVTALALQIELDDFETQQHHQQTLVDQLEQNPILGYLDGILLSFDRPMPSANPFAEPNQFLDLEAKHLDRKDESLTLTHIAACQSEKYKAYRQRYRSLPALPLAMQYTITQKLYPGRPFSVGLAAKVVHPRLELLWGSPHESARPDDPLAQIWCIQPMLKFHPPQWIVIAITSETRKLNAIALEDGRMAQEGTREYLVRSLQIMVENPDEYTNDLGKLVLEALEQGRVKYTHLHQTQDLETGEPRDIVQLQFLLR
jgi:hypothetical protein